MIADSRGYNDIIEGIETPPDEKENLEILDADMPVVKVQKDKAVDESCKQKMVQRPSDVYRRDLTQHC